MGENVMKKIILIPLFALILFTCINCTQKKQNELSEQEKNEIRQDAKEFMESLRTVLVKEMQVNGVAAAVAVCSDTAQILTNEYGAEKGIYIKRVSFNNRNAGNYPDKFEADGLRHFEELKTAADLMKLRRFSILWKRGDLKVYVI
jgi:hypothetical protein